MRKSHAAGPLADDLARCGAERADLSLAERLAQVIRGHIDTGRYRPGERLPPHRAIAGEAGVSIGTVTRAIEQLSREGVVRGEVGRGTYVQAGQDTAAPYAGSVDLMLNAPPPLLDTTLLAAASDMAWRRAAALPYGGYGDHAGTLEQRGVMAQWLDRTRLTVAPEAMLLCQGAQQAIYLAFGDVRAGSASIATEAATFAGAIAAARALGLDLHAVEHDAQGMLPEALDRVLRRHGCKAVYVTPVCQNPLGFETPPARREQILEVCARHDAVLIEDDIYSVYAGLGRHTYKALAPERVYFLTSLSKCLTPLVRLGVLVPPGKRLAAVSAALRAHSWGAAPLAVETGCALIELGADERTAQALREEAAVRTRMAAEWLGLSLDALPMPAGAPHIWLPMPAWQAERLARHCAEQGVRVTPPEATSFGEGGAQGVRLCIMAPANRRALAHGLRVVAAARHEPAGAVV